MLITQGNEIIRRLQSDLKAAKSKLKLKNVVTVQQEKLLDERSATQDSHFKEIATLKESLAKINSECDSQRQKNEELKKKLDESKAIIEDNNHGNSILTLVIEWLHKQLNDEAMNHQVGPSFKQPISSTFGGIDFEKYAVQPVTDVNLF